jgi:hypothetical protein
VTSRRLVSRLLLTTVLVSGCATHDPSPAEPPSTLKQANVVAVLPEDAPDIRLRTGTNENPIPLEPPIPIVKGTKAIAQANERSKKEIRSDRFRGAKLVYQVEEGGRYPIRVPRNGRTLVTFLPDEEFFDMLRPVNSTVFQVEDTASGTESGMRDSIAIMCHGDALRAGVSATDQVIYITTKREYILDLACQRTGNILVGFDPPFSSAATGMSLAERAAAVKRRRSPQARSISGGAPLENLDCRYTAQGEILNLRGEQISVCTDGRQTIISFPTPREAGGTVPMPAVFSDPPPNALASTNPITGARSWIVDRPLSEAELQYGEETITIVRREH